MTLISERILRSGLLEIENLFRDDYKAMIESFIYNENPLTFDQLGKNSIVRG